MQKRDKRGPPEEVMMKDNHHNRHNQHGVKAEETMMKDLYYHLSQHNQHPVNQVKGLASG